MGAIEDEYEALDADVSEEKFREAVEAKVEQMGGLADEETAAKLVAHELRDEEVEGVADVDAGMEEAKFVAKVTSVGDLREFERDGDDEDGLVLNADVADETGSIRVTFWDEQAGAADDDLAEGDVLRIAGRPRDGYSGVEVSVDRAEPEPDVDVEVATREEYAVEDLALGLSDVTLRGLVLDTEPVREFDRDDGSTGRVANLLLGDDTGRVRVTLWDDATELAAAVSPGESVEVLDGYVKERDGSLELHCNDDSAVEVLEEAVSFSPDATPISELEIGERADVAGVVRSADPKRTFDRDDGSEGQVRNVRLQDDSGDVRVALWGEKADRDVGPGDELLFTDVEIQDGWQDDLEASAGWRSSVVELADGETATDAGSDAGGGESTGLDAFADGDAPAGDSGTGGAAGAADADESGARGDAGGTADDGGAVEFTGTVVQAGDPVILDDGEQTVTVRTDADVVLGQEVTARGRLSDGDLEAEDVL